MRTVRASVVLRSVQRRAEEMSRWVTARAVDVEIFEKVAHLGCLMQRWVQRQLHKYRRRRTKSAMYTNWREQSKEYLARYLDGIGGERVRERERRMITGNGSEESLLKCEFGLVKR